MILFIRKIPANTQIKELIEFVSPAIKGGFFRRSGVIGKVEILALQDLRLRTLEFHGLVTVEPDQVAIRAIKKLKGCRFKGKHVIVRQYWQRDWHNDPRRSYASTANVKIMERRVHDRRRGKELEVMEDMSEHFSSKGDFLRKGG